jgi:hypothetical protein
LLGGCAAQRIVALTRKFPRQIPFPFSWQPCSHSSMERAPSNLPVPFSPSQQGHTRRSSKLPRSINMIHSEVGVQFVQWEDKTIVHCIIIVVCMVIGIPVKLSLISYLFKNTSKAINVLILWEQVRKMGATGFSKSPYSPYSIWPPKESKDFWHTLFKSIIYILSFLQTEKISP